MSSPDRIVFDTRRIDETARAIDRCLDDFTAHCSAVSSERDRSVASFVGDAGDEFRGLCDRWLRDAAEFAVALRELAGWLDARNSDYAAARSASQSMFPG